MEDKKEQIKKLAQEIGFDEIQNIINQLKQEPSYNDAKEWFQKEILNKVSIHQDQEKYPDSLFFFLNDNVVMEQDSRNDYLWIDYYKIWSFFETKYDLNDQEIRDLIKPRVENHFKMRVSTPYLYANVKHSWWRTISK